MVTRGQPLGVIDAAGHTSDAAGCLHCIQPLLLLGPEPAGWCLHLDAEEHRHLGADHVRRHGHRPPADQVSAAFAQAEADRTAMLVAQGAGIVAKQAYWATTASKPDVLLDALLAHS